MKFLHCPHCGEKLIPKNIGDEGLVPFCLERKKQMKVYDLIHAGSFKVLNEGDNPEREISVIYCCDLLSIAMGRMPADAAWVTVMGNINTLAVATLADAACIILAEGCNLDEPAFNKAKEQGITVLLSELPVFDAALISYQQLHA